MSEKQNKNETEVAKEIRAATIDLEAAPLETFNESSRFVGDVVTKDESGKAIFHTRLVLLAD